MKCTTSERFASLTATGADWRAVTRNLLEGLESGAPRDADYNLGFLYVSDLLADDIPGMLDLIRSETGVAHWVGTVGYGVCGNGVSHVDMPAASILLGSFDPDRFRVFPPTDLSLAKAREALDPWLETHDTMLTLVHGDPQGDGDPLAVMAELERLAGGFIVGGMASSRGANILIADHVSQGGLSGVVFSSDIDVATTLSQGCAPIGPVHTITHAEGHLIAELDGKRTFDVFADDLKNMALRQAGPESGTKADGTAVIGPVDRETYEKMDLDAGVQSLFSGDVHVAFPVQGSDQRDYMVRNIAGLDPESGVLAVHKPVEVGEHVLFVHRDAATMRDDLSRTMADLRDRLIRTRGQFAPQGAIYISCLARAPVPGSTAEDDEMAQIRHVLGDLPLAGFYAHSEISNRRLYGYTGVLILFL